MSNVSIPADADPTDEWIVRRTYELMGLRFAK